MNSSIRVCDHNDSPCCHWAFCSNTQGDKQLSPDRAKNSQRGKKIYITSQHTQRIPELNVYVCVCVWSRAGGQSPQRAADETMCVTESRPIHTLTVGVLLTTDFIMAINRPYEWRWCNHTHSDALIVIIVLLIRRQHKQCRLLTTNHLMSRQYDDLKCSCTPVAS